MTLESRYGTIKGRVESACEQAGRPADAVRIIGVSKTVGLDSVAEATKAGIHDFGENRPDELVRKHDAFPDERWHFIGNIQSRQLSNVVGRAYLIHSLYQESHAAKIDRLAAEKGIVQDVLIEVNDGETNKQGVDPDKVKEMVEFCEGLEHVRVKGLMIMAPIGSAEEASKTFAMLARVRDEVVESFSQQGKDVQLGELSMGMSDDYLEAIPLGATMVRIGRAIFSDEYDAILDN
ncbi:Predicted enzyme with a TIM-barrel fold [Slackia heliotrinireducens]|uniref:Pyridoxal phosphate homeostasis protein n=1 Tax=Slackia heliotrinireducens (strain ATCC 29202 / DSM 20476 / NCTC 11029 / RHS 1) TaxID=471855 RepID=C7N4V3_SLAHD|nr:YggS family pyridoxal phosphate-dependent enzyme [Slackia heliotrinireducens]ACV21938.1 pyridoxal phosphate enzyme, YggS family [Slackia heliotrinireducens DSM 20476]VEG99774.1 Predicted enzyme with a TIM-barrel fold [Slackia heliotrinireducens]